MTNNNQTTTSASQSPVGIPNYKVVIYSIHKEAVYRRALAFVDTVEPTACGGLATVYRNRAGDKLTTLNEVVEAAKDGNLLAGMEAEPVWLAEAA